MTGRDTIEVEIEVFRKAAETGICPRCGHKYLKGKMDLIGYTMTCPACFWWMALTSEEVR